MCKSRLFLVGLLTAVAFCGCTKEQENPDCIPPETAIVSVWQEAEIPVSTEIIVPVPAATETAATEPEENVPMETDDTIAEEKTVTYSIVDEYVYAITDVNIRTGPGTQYKVLDYLPKGDEINRIAIGSDGWSRVVYKGQNAYMRSQYLIREKVEEEAVPLVTEQIPPQAENTTEPSETGSESTESTAQPIPTEVTQPLTEVPTETPTEISAEDTESERIDTSALTAYGNSYAASLGFTIDYGVRDGYFPPDTVDFFSIRAAYSNVADNVNVLYNNLISRDGTVEGCRCCVTVVDNGDGSYTTTVYYG